MAQIGLTAAGAFIGYQLGGGATGTNSALFAAIGAEVGSLAGSYIDSLWLYSSPATRAPNYYDTHIQGASYGKAIVSGYGADRFAGELIWSGGITPHEQSAGGSSKGLGGSGATRTTYTASFAVGMCEGKIACVRRIWADKKLVADFTPASRFLNLRGAILRIYNGSETQMPCPIIQASRGARYTPAFRGLAYMVFQDLQLADFANHIPQIEFEVVWPDGGEAYPKHVVATGGSDVAGDWGRIDNSRGVYYAVSASSGAYMINVADDSIVASNPLLTPIPESSGGITIGQQGIYAQVDLQNFSTLVQYDRDTLQPTGYRCGTSHGLSPLATDIPAASWLRASAGFVFLRSLDELTASGEWEIAIVLESIATPSLAATIVQRIIQGLFSRLYTFDPLLPFLLNQTYLGPVMLGSVVNPVTNSQPTSLSQGMPECDGEGNIWVFGFTDTPAVHLCQCALDSSGLTLNITATYDLTSAFSTNPGTGSEIYPAIMFLPDQNSFILSMGSTLIKWSLDTRSVTGAELANVGGYGADGDFTSWQNGDPQGYFLGNRGSNISLLDTSAWQVVETWAYASGPFGSLVGSSACGLALDLLSWAIWRPEYLSANVDQLMLDRQGLATAILGDIVADLCEQGGLTDVTDFDRSALTQTVRGYTIGRQTDIVAALQPLASAFFFDAVESDGKIKFVNRGATPAVTLVKNDLGAYEASKKRPDPLEITDGQVDDLPVRVEVSYKDQGLNYDHGLQASPRLAATTSAKNHKPVQLNIVMRPWEAKAVANIQLVSEWLARRTYKFTVANPWLKLDPTDVINVDKDGSTYVMRLQLVDRGANGSSQIQACGDDPKLYALNSVSGGPADVGGDSEGRGANGASGVATATDPTPISPTLMRLLDIPALRDSDALSAGLYLVVGPLLETLRWDGCAILKSSDGGATFENWETLATVGAIGYTTTVLPAPRAWASWDATSSVTVRMVCGETQLASAANELAILNGANAALVGNEVIQFSTVTLNGDGTYTLGGGMTRGRRGSDGYGFTHVVGERFVLLSSSSASSIDDIIEDNGQIALIRAYQPVTFDQPMPATTVVPFADSGARLKPYAAGYVAGARDMSGNLTITWIRRTRTGGDDDWRDGVTDVALGETSESYSTDILDNMGNVLRTIASSSQSAAYSAADQTTDFGSPQAAIAVNVYQISSVVGRGFASPATV